MGCSEQFLSKRGIKNKWRYINHQKYLCLFISNKLSLTATDTWALYSITIDQNLDGH
jgi:hypothetical protein